MGKTQAYIYLFVLALLFLASLLWLDKQNKIRTTNVQGIEKFSKQGVYINPKIIQNQSKIVMPGLPKEWNEPDNIERSFRDGVWYEAIVNETLLMHQWEYERIISRNEKLKKISALRIGEKAPSGNRIIAHAVETNDKDIFIVQVGIEEFGDPNQDYPFGLSFTIAEDYECDLAKATCVETDILKKADAHMAANKIYSTTAQVYSFWRFWIKEFNTIVGYPEGEGTPISDVYMYYPLRDEHTKTDIDKIEAFTFSPSKRRLMVLHSDYQITTFAVQGNFTPIQHADYSALRKFFEPPYHNSATPLYLSETMLWSEDESKVYFIQKERIFAHDINTGITERLVDATAFHNLPESHARSLNEDKFQPLGPELSKSGRYLHYYLSPYDQTEKNIHVVIDLLNQNKSKEFIADKSM